MPSSEEEGMRKREEVGRALNREPETRTHYQSVSVADFLPLFC
jgi:hypothetical protein